MLNPNISKVFLESIEYKLYGKHLILNNIGLKGQKRLKKSKVLIIGAGGIGCPTILYLSLIGIGLIGVVDSDKVELSNLSRQILYNTSDINNKKCDSAKNKLSNTVPYCKIVKHPYRLTKNNALEIIQYYDLIIDATDNFTTRYIIDRICYKLHKPYIYGAVANFESQLSLFNYKNNIRYSDIYKKIKTLFNDCNNNGIIGIVTGHIGLLQALEAIKIILGLNNNINNNLIIYYMLNNSSKQIKIYPTRLINNIKTQNNKINTKQNKNISYNYENLTNRYMIIDIRKSYEFLGYHIPCAINIPLNKLQHKKTLIFLQKYSKQTNLYLYCNRSYRSLIINKTLNSLHIKHFILYHL
uniref:Molybdopterin biosynthesis protein n=1 Tax=Taenioma perpusillum TaxID=210852 RepID=A0A1Z1MS46_9FLOR|nr:Molybdopterin biosynthesis protein [Taenioma perpusillum]ARW68585.1 Molybdopterin biosynthesis protein [Taenioma perpusillum]